MKVVINMVKGWGKVLPFYLFILLPLFASCSEADDQTDEWDDWQNRNDVFFANQYQNHSEQTERSFVLPSWAMPTNREQGVVLHTQCVLVDVIVTGPASTVSPLYSDSVAINYRGRLMPTKHYPEGYEFDRSYQKYYDPDVDVPVCLPLTNVVEGFSTVLQKMHVGDLWRVTIPYQLGYGATEKTGIPAYSTLIFDVELVDFWNKKKGDRY